MTRQLRVFIDDETQLARVIAEYLDRAGYGVASVADGADATEPAYDWPTEMVMLDVTFPDVEGMEPARPDRHLAEARVILVASLDDTDSAVPRRAGTAVADPGNVVSARALLSRVPALLWPHLSGSTEQARLSQRVGTVSIGGLAMDHEARTVHVDGRPVELTWTEFEMLAALAERPRAALSRRELIEAVRDERWQGDERVIDVHVAHLRHKLCDDVAEHRFVRTVRGVGYGMGQG